MINKEKIFENVKLKISISNFDEEENIEMKKNNKNILKFINFLRLACTNVRKSLVKRKESLKRLFSSLII